jgi:hypothetical protein
MGKVGKQADRKAAKAPKEEETSAAPTGSFVEIGKALLMSTCIAQAAPKVPALIEEVKAWKENGFVVPATPAAEAKPAEEKEEDNAQEETNDAPAAVETTASLFESLGARLTVFNGLGLFASSDGAKAAFLAVKGQELDFGPRAKRTGSPGLDRMTANLQGNMAQYLYVLFALMLVRAFLFRSFFACLPWLVGYQFLSLLLPLTNLEKLPQVPLEKVPVVVRLCISLLIHGLVWFFFIYEAVWKTYFFEKIPLAGIILYHSYAVRPAEGVKSQ